jgi:hypothetical protein
MTIIIAKLTDSDRCEAAGLVVEDSSPVLAMCRALVDAGHDPATPLHAYRGNAVALRVRSIGEAAGLEINSKGTAFKPRRAVRTAPPVRQIAKAA